MVTVVEYQDSEGALCLQTSFGIVPLEIAKEHFSDALENSSNECRHPYIALTAYSDDGRTYIDSDFF